MQMYYGVQGHWYPVDVEKCRTVENNYRLPCGDVTRSQLFQVDPIIGVEKSVKIVLSGSDTEVILSAQEECIFTQDRILLRRNPCEILTKLHQKLKLVGGSMSEEYPEQTMSVMFIKPTSKVLEIGGNVGRNSLVIASILNSSADLVVLECDPTTAKVLQVNRDSNDFKFGIEPVALSKRNLYQSGWNTQPSDVDIPGWTKILTLSYTQLREKYSGIVFDTLVLDCEGAFYWILQDEPDILNGISTIIMENDYSTLEQYQYVANTLLKSGFHIAYSQPLPYELPMCCREWFYQVFIRASPSTKPSGAVSV
jgi:FkbM family methyltransferase